MEPGIGHLAGIIQVDGDLGMPLDAGDRGNGDRLCHALSLPPGKSFRVYNRKEGYCHQDTKTPMNQAILVKSTLVPGVLWPNMSFLGFWTVPSFGL